MDVQIRKFPRHKPKTTSRFRRNFSRLKEVRSHKTNFWFIFCAIGTVILENIIQN